MKLLKYSIECKGAFIMEAFLVVEGLEIAMEAFRFGCGCGGGYLRPVCGRHRIHGDAIWSRNEPIIERNEVDLGPRTPQGGEEHLP